MSSFIPHHLAKLLRLDKPAGNVNITIQVCRDDCHGLRGLVEEEIRRSAPVIAAAAEKAIFDAILHGGAEDSTNGKRG